MTSGESTGSFEETCANCRFLMPDDTCGNPESVYHLRPAVYRDGDEVLQAGWCDRWEASGVSETES